MYAVTVLVARKPDVSRKAFQAWWAVEHLPETLELLGGPQHVVVPVDEQLHPSGSGTAEASSFDGVVVFLFADEAAARKSLSVRGTPDYDADTATWIARSSVVLGSVVVIPT